MSRKREPPFKHRVDGYWRGSFHVDNHERGVGDPPSKHNLPPRERKVVGDDKTVVETTDEPTKNGSGIDTLLPPHDPDTVQVIHMSPREYLELASPDGFGGINEYRVGRIQEEISKGESLLVPRLDVFTESLDVVASKGVDQAIWAYRRGIKKIPVMVVHCERSGVIIGPRQFTPILKTKNLNHREFIQQGKLGPSAWDDVKNKLG